MRPKHHNGCAIYDDGQCTCDALPYPRDTARSAVATPAYLQIDWLERRVKELEAEVERLRSNQQGPHNYVHKAFHEQMLERVAERQKGAMIAAVNDDEYAPYDGAEVVRIFKNVPLVTEGLRNDWGAAQNALLQAETAYRVVCVCGAAEGQDLRAVAERQREACAKEAADFYANGMGDPQYAVRFTPLVTEGKK